MKLFGKRYLGLAGTKLNIAIGVIAGIDFLYVALAITGLDADILEAFRI